MSRRSPLPAVRSAVGHAVAVIVLAALLLLGPSLVSVAHATAPPVTPDPTSMGTNPFIPDDANVGDCVSSAPRPECGSDQRGGFHQYATLLILFLGTIFIGWRVARGVRARDRAVNDAPQQVTPPTNV